MTLLALHKPAAMATRTALPAWDVVQRDTAWFTSGMRNQPPSYKRSDPPPPPAAAPPAGGWPPQSCSSQALKRRKQDAENMPPRRVSPRVNTPDLTLDLAGVVASGVGGVRRSLKVNREGSASRHTGGTSSWCFLYLVPVWTSKLLRTGSCCPPTPPVTTLPSYLGLVFLFCYGLREPYPVS